MKNEAYREQFSLTLLAEQIVTLQQKETSELSKHIYRSYESQDALDFHITHTFRHYMQMLSNHPTQTVVCQQMNRYFQRVHGNDARQTAFQFSNINHYVCTVVIVQLCYNFISFCSYFITMSR